MELDVEVKIDVEVEMEVEGKVEVDGEEEKEKKRKKEKKSDQYPSRVIQRKREREKSHQYLPKPGNPAPGFQAQGLLVVTDGWWMVDGG